MKITFLPVIGTWCVVLLLAGVARAQTSNQLRPIPLTGYNADVIADGTSAVASTDLAIDKDFVYFVGGFISGSPGLGLAAGNTFPSDANPNTTFLIQPADVKNVLLLTDQSDSGDSEVSSGALTLTAPGNYGALAVLVTGLDSSNPVGYTLNFSAGASTQGSFVAPDNVVGTGAVALSGFGRVVRATGQLDPTIPATSPQLYEIDISLSAADAARTLTGITFTNLCPGPFRGATGTSERKIAVFGVSGYSSTQQTLQPLTATGYDQDVIADPGESAAGSTSTTIDSINDYYATGFVGGSAVGLPAGGTFQSAANPITTFALQPANVSNVLLFTGTGKLTLPTPGGYAQLAVLATALNGSASVNYTLQFNDTGAPTLGTFIVPDNFSTDATAALSGFGRVVRQSGQADQSQTQDFPRLFEGDITLSAQDAARPLASIVFDNVSPGDAPGAAPQEVAVFGLSGAQMVAAPPVGAAAFSASGYTVARAAGTATITVDRIGGSAGQLSVVSSTEDGTASAVNGDYTPEMDTLVWTDGDTTPKTFDVPIDASASTPGIVDFVVTLTAVDGAQTLGSPSLATVNILNAEASATPIQEVDILSPPPLPTGIEVVQNQAVAFYVSVQSIQGIGVQVQYFASDDTGLTPQQFLTPDASGNGKVTWVPAQPGKYHLNAVATAGSQSVPASVPIIVVAAASAEDTGPQVALLGSLADRQFAVGETINLVASAVDADGTTPLSTVQFYANNQLLGTASVTTDTARAGAGKTRRDAGGLGSVTARLAFIMTAELQQLLAQQQTTLVTAVGTNAQGVSAVSPGVTIFPEAARATGLSCVITSPADGSNLPAQDTTQTATVAVTNSQGQVAQVELFVDQQSVGTRRVTPFQFTLPPLAKGAHILAAIATDANAVSQTSDAVIVQATNAGLPEVDFSVAHGKVTVGSGDTAELTVTRTGSDLSQVLKVPLLVKGSAVNGVDYTLSRSKIKFKRNKNTATIDVTPIGAAGAAGNKKTLKIILQPGNGYTVGADAVGKVKIFGGE